MKRLLGLVGCGLTVVVVLLWGATASARFGYPDETPYVRLSGVLLALEDETQQHALTLTILVKGSSWRFQLDDVEEVKAHDQEDAGLHDLQRHTIRLYGPTPLLVLLQQPTIIGQPITIEGYLYPKERRLLVVTITGVPVLAGKAARLEGNGQ